MLGDAAHAMTPNMGQGGCQAIEDAVVVAHLLADDADVPAALAAYTEGQTPAHHPDQPPLPAHR